jgi:hypothetical protein
MKMRKPDFSGVFQYMGMEDCDADRAIVLAVAGYERIGDAAEELEITEHQASFLWNYLNERNALYDMENYTALVEWAEDFE